MFVRTTNKGYNGNGEQYCHGWFLMVFADPDPKSPIKCELRGVIRHVKMKQVGQWLMGRVKLDGIEFAVHGTYGGDGRPVCEIDRRHAVFWDRLVPLPPDIQEDFWSDDGPAIHEWALKNFKNLHKCVIRKRKQDAPLQADNPAN